MFLSPDNSHDSSDSSTISGRRVDEDRNFGDANPEFDRRSPLPMAGERSRQSEVCSFREVVEAVGRGRCARMPISFERFRATASDHAKCARNSTRRSHSERPTGKSSAACLSPKSIKYLAVLAFLRALLA